MSIGEPRDAPIYRLIHVDSLDTVLRREGLHAPNAVPDDGLPYRAIHRGDVQESRMRRSVPAGPGGVLLDYVPFYFGARSVMLYQLHKGLVGGHTEGQAALVYLVSSAAAVAASGAGWVFTDGHALAAFTTWHDSLDGLDTLDWQAVGARLWKDTLDDPDRKRRKQAEFLVHGFCGWNLIAEIGVFDPQVAAVVGTALARHRRELSRPVVVRREWYY